METFKRTASKQWQNHNHDLFLSNPLETTAASGGGVEYGGMDDYLYKNNHSDYCVALVQQKTDF